MRDRDNLVIHSIYDLRQGESVGYLLMDAFMGRPTTVKGLKGKSIFVSVGEPAVSKTLFNGNVLEEAFEESGRDRKFFFPLFLSWERYITATEAYLQKPKSKFKPADWDQVSDRVTEEYKYFREMRDKVYAGNTKRKPQRILIAGDLSGVAKENKGTSTVQELATWDETFFLIFLPNPVNQMRARVIRKEMQNLQRRINRYISRGQEVPSDVLVRAREVWVNNHVVPDLSTPEEILEHTRIMGSPAVMNKFNQEIQEKTYELEMTGSIRPQEVELPEYIIEDMYRAFGDQGVAESWISYIQRRKAFLDYLAVNVWRIPEEKRMMVFSRHIACDAGVNQDIMWRQRILDASSAVNF